METLSGLDLDGGGSKLRGALQSTCSGRHEEPELQGTGESDRRRWQIYVAVPMAKMELSW